MSELSPRLGLPFLMAAQAQKHVTHNEALLRLDQVTQLVLQELDATDPPETPLDGQIWALGTAPTEAWAGQGGDLAAWFDGDWHFVTPGAGWQAGFGSELRIFDGSAWVVPGAGTLENLPGLGINTSYDATNRLSVAAEATLLNHEGAGHQLKLNKAAATDTASLLFQTGFSGRAEMGTAGNDDFSVKVSADGSAWHDGLVVARATGALSAPNGLDAATLTRAGSPVYARSNILGTVSQSGAVPTGAVIQRGSNANGVFVRFADGTQICTRSITFDLAGATSQTFAMPAVFSSVEATSFGGGSGALRPSGGSGVSDRHRAFISSSISAASNSEWNFRVAEDLFPKSEMANFAVTLFAYGRWF